MMRSNMNQQVGTRGPNAPEGRGYNREGFRGRGPIAVRPGVPVVTRPGFPADQAMPIRMKKGGMVSPKGQGCEMVKKSCKVC